MENRLGAVSVWTALVGSVLVGIGDAAGSAVAGVIGGLLLVTGVIGFLGVGIVRSRQDGLGILAALGRAAKDALRLAWLVFKGA